MQEHARCRCLRCANSPSAMATRACSSTSTCRWNAGEFVAMLGESGVGKSTLLNCIAGLDSVDAGTVHIDGAEITALAERAQALLRREHLGFVFQAFHVLPHLSVAAQRRAAAAAAAAARRSACGARARRGRPRGLRRTHAAHAVGRPAAARRDRARAGAPAAPHPRRRADRQPRPGTAERVLGLLASQVRAKARPACWSRTRRRGGVMPTGCFV